MINEAFMCQMDKDRHRPAEESIKLELHEAYQFLTEQKLKRQRGGRSNVSYYRTGVMNLHLHIQMDKTPRANTAQSVRGPHLVKLVVKKQSPAEVIPKKKSKIVSTALDWTAWENVGL